jgi:Uma2 family endonuclease
MIAIPAGFSPQEYLVMERENAIRHEYRQGLVYAMAGGGDNHSRLNINLLTEINLHLRDSDWGASHFRENIIRGKNGGVAPEPPRHAPSRSKTLSRL